MTLQNRGRVFVGAVLIGLGLVLLVSQFLVGFGDSVFAIATSAALIGGYFYRRAYGLLVLGCLLLGLGIGQLAGRIYSPVGDLSAIGLGIGFVAIYVIDFLYRRTTHWWPLVPGAVLIIIGLAEGNPVVQYWLSVGWPLILVVIGIVILAGSLGFRSSWK